MTDCQRTAEMAELTRRNRELHRVSSPQDEEQAPARPRLNELEDQAIGLARQVHRDALGMGVILRPMDAGIAGQLADVVRDAWVAGERDQLQVVLSAIEEMLADPGHEDVPGDIALDELKKLIS
jgi:hypothetical protein